MRQLALDLLPFDTTTSFPIFMKNLINMLTVKAFATRMKME